jgi:dipeptidase E
MVYIESSNVVQYSHNSAILECMKYYLSSYKLGNELDRLGGLIKQTSGKFGYIPNARDFTSADPERRSKQIEEDMNDLQSHGADVALLDLKDILGKNKN